MTSLFRYIFNKNILFREKIVYTLKQFSPVKNANWKGSSIIHWGIKYDAVIQQIPSHIWIFWDGETRPSVVDICIQQIKSLNPDYQVHILSLQNFHQFIDEPIEKYLSLGFPAFTDILRLKLLHKFGGIWMDASLLTFLPLAEIFKTLQIEKSSCILFNHPAQTTDPEFPIFENWFIASTKENMFISCWMQEYERCLNSASPKDYYPNLYPNIEDISQGMQYLDYLLAYLSGQVALRTMVNKTSITFLNVEDLGYSYYYYYGRDKGEGHLMHKLWMIYRAPKIVNPMIKLISFDRMKISEYDSRSLISQKSIIGKLKTKYNYSSL